MLQRNGIYSTSLRDVKEGMDTNMVWEFQTNSGKWTNDGLKDKRRLQGRLQIEREQRQFVNCVDTPSM